ncbi:Hypothetical Protein FCC1311_075982 [Hondaea fermentalgiana]|uniref:Uncharacterized protein n=1 Tax=Hondaea fermentalgiana TaxID=2315210 RepID=A0A2R5GU08_9STRA|nr:Hypothetical Protein FCC1311_075982 [Hondaea fermentalgiana]|eukprot:GBG31374.1 Hypothetical Protein FCC1311_075982 [Hondaea fermentalgiana]
MASFKMGGSRKFSAIVGQRSNSSVSRVEVQLAHMHHSSLTEEIERLVQENADFARSLALLEEVTRKRSDELDNASLLLSREAEHMEKCDADLLQLETTSNELAEKVANVREGQSASRFRHRQLQRMVMRAQDARNVAKQKAEGLQKSLESKSTAHEVHELQVKLAQVQQESEVLDASKSDLLTKLEDFRAEVKNKFAERARILSDLKQLRILQIDTALRRKEITMQAQGVSKRQERRLKKASIANSKRKTVTESVLANMSCSLSRYEKTVRKIQKTTGIWDVNTVVDRFFSQESKRTQLEKDLVEATERRKLLEQRLEQSTAQLLHAREYGVESSGQDVADLGLLEGQVTESGARLRHQRETFRTSYRLIVALVEGTRTLARGLNANVPPELQRVLEADSFSSGSFANQYARLAKMMLGDLLSRLVYILNHAPGARGSLENAAADDAFPPSRARMRRKLSNVSQVSVQAQQWVFEYASVASPTSPASAASPGQASRAMLRAASPTELQTLQQVERSLNSILHNNIAALGASKSVGNTKPSGRGVAATSAGPKGEDLRTRNIRVCSRRGSWNTPDSSFSTSASKLAIAGPPHQGKDHEREQTLNSMLKNMVETQGKVTALENAGTGKTKQDSDESLRGKKSSNGAGGSAVAAKTSSNADKLHNKDDALADTIETIDDLEDIAEAKSCFGFLRNNPPTGAEEIARSTTRSMRRRLNSGEKEAPQEVFDETLNHNRVLFNLLGARRTEFARPEAIPAKDLYKDVIRSDIKKPCFTREEIKLLSSHLVKQDSQAKTLTELAAKARGSWRENGSMRSLGSRAGGASKVALLPASVLTAAERQRAAKASSPRTIPSSFRL